MKFEWHYTEIGLVLFFLFLVGGGAFLLLLADSRAKKSRLSKILARGPGDLKLMHQEVFTQMGVDYESFDFAISMIARAFRLPKEYLRLTDEFGTDLGQSSKIDGSASQQLEELEWEVAEMIREAGISDRRDLGFEEVTTVRNFIFLVAALRKRKNLNGETVHDK